MDTDFSFAVLFLNGIAWMVIFFFNILRFIKLLIFFNTIDICIGSIFLIL